MIEITATQNGKPVFIDMNKPIDVQMKSDKSDGEYNVYFLDTNNRNWEFKGVDNLLASKNEERGTKNDKHSPKDIAKLRKEISKAKVDEVKIKAELASQKPTKPRQVTPGSFTFMLDVLETEFPELTIYGKTKFEVLDKDKTFNNQVYSTEWEDATLKEIIHGEQYRITLTRGNVSKSFIGAPVLEGKDLITALDAYNKKFKEYEAKLAERIKNEKAKIEAQKMELVAWEREADEKNRLRISDYTMRNLPNEIMARFTGNNASSSLVARAFTVSSFGIWNCDNPQTGPKGQKVSASFVDEIGTPLPISVAYLCEKGNNMMYTFIPQQFNKFSFDPKQKNVIWGMLPDGKLAYGLEETFAAENIKGKKLEFKMTIVNEKISSLKQVKELFGI